MHNIALASSMDRVYEGGPAKASCTNNDKHISTHHSQLIIIEYFTIPISLFAKVQIMIPKLSFSLINTDQVEVLNKCLVD